MMNVTPTNRNNPGLYRLLSVKLVGHLTPDPVINKYEDRCFRSALEVYVSFRAPPRNFLSEDTLMC